MQYNIYNTKAKPTKSSQPKELRWNDLLEVKELEYEKNTITHQAAGSKRDQVIVLIC